MFETITRRTPMSRGFRCALLGIAMTIRARVGPWSWPGWPAVKVLDFALAHAAPSVAGSVYKGLGILTLIIVNTGFWALVAYAAVSAWTALRRPARERDQDS
jgi:hypothetical protein